MISAIKALPRQLCRRRHSMVAIPAQELADYQVMLGDWLRCTRCTIEALVPLETVGRRLLTGREPS